MRVDTLARPARGPSRKLSTFGCGFFSVKTWIAFTWSAGVIGLSTLTASGTALPFSDSGGRSSFTCPALTRDEPTTARMASCIAARRRARRPHGDDHAHAQTGGDGPGALQECAARRLALHHGLSVVR